jgi:quinolinate synthase
MTSIGTGRKSLVFRQERFTAADVRDLRERFPGVQVLVHPECPPEVLAEADFAGSTAALADYVATHAPQRVVLLTECSMSDNVALESPATQFVRPCNLCPHMKRITLAGIYESLLYNRHVVEVPAEIAQGARTAIQRMLSLPKVSRPAAFDTHRPIAAVTLMSP